MQRKAGTPRKRQKGAAKPSGSSLEMRLSSILPQIEQWAESVWAKGVARERKRVEQRAQRQGILPRTLARESSNVRRRDLRHSAELQIGQIIRVGLHLADSRTWLTESLRYAMGIRTCKQD